MRTDQSGRTSAELVPIADRLRFMQVFRLVIAAVVVFFGAVVDGAPVTALSMGTLAFLFVSLFGELLWRGFRSRGLVLFGGMLIVDGAYLAWAAYQTGAGDSPLRHLVVLHLIAVALLASYRTGLKLAIWHSLLLLLVFELQQRTALEAARTASAAPGTSFEQMVTFIAVFWLVVLSTATFSAVNERELRRRRYDLEALAQLAAALEQVSHSSAVGEVLIARLVDSFGFDRAIFAVPDEHGHVVVAAHGTAAVGTPIRRTGSDPSVIELVAASRETLLVRELDVLADHSLARILPDANNLLVVPLLAENGTQGVVVAEHSFRSGSRIERRVVTAVERFASHAALSLRNAVLVETLERMASTDALTGVANRRSFEAAAEAELERSKRDRTPLALILFDIDNFKRLNDTYGHREGDAVLRMVAGVLAEHRRPYDTVARYGGEEFAIVLPNCTMTLAAEIGDRLRLAVASLPHEAGVTVSAGVAASPAHGHDVDALVRAADAALYESKGAGRNRVSLAAPTAAERVPAVG